MEIWTLQYRPFTMGGKVYQPAKCDVEVDGPHDLGGGYQGYIATAPNGRTFVAEATSGAIVGPTLEDVRGDISQADPAVMAEQVAKAIAQSATAAVITPEDFWQCLHCSA